MPKAGELDWGDLYKGKVGQPEDAKSKPLGYVGPTLKKGEVPPTPSNEEIASEIMRGMDAPGLRQMTDEEMFGHLVVSPEQAKAAEEAFDNKIADFYSAASKPLTGQTEVPDEEWGTGKSFNSMLPKEELAKRNMYLGDD